jgi:hypothetical protein
VRSTVPMVASALAALAAVSLGPTAVAVSAGTIPACRNLELHASYRPSEEAAASHRFGHLVLRNVSRHSCRTGGYGGLSYVGAGNGTQVGAAADRTPSRVRELVLRPGQRTVSAVVEVVAAVYSPRVCRPAHVDGFRVYVPNAFRSQFVKHPTTGCRNTGLHLISHKAFRRP